MSTLIAALHRSIEDIIIDPRDYREYERADNICAEIWQWSTTMGITPWSYCLDRYCSCKMMLSEWEPDVLPGLTQGPIRPGGRRAP